MKKLIILSQSHLASQFNHWLPMADIPNEKGFQCIVQVRGGIQYLATVIRGEYGVHSLDINETIPYGGNLHWRELTDADREAIKKIETDDSIDWKCNGSPFEEEVK